MAWGLGEPGGAGRGRDREVVAGAPGDHGPHVRRYVRCRNATAEVRLRTFLSPCVDDCGPYGQCKLLRTHNYLYAACECKAGERAGLASEPWGGLLGGRGRLVWTAVTARIEDGFGEDARAEPE